MSTDEKALDQEKVREIRRLMQQRRDAELTRRFGADVRTSPEYAAAQRQRAAAARRQAQVRDRVVEQRQERVRAREAARQESAREQRAAQQRAAQQPQRAAEAPTAGARPRDVSQRAQMQKSLQRRREALQHDRGVSR